MPLCGNAVPLPGHQVDHGRQGQSELRSGAAAGGSAAAPDIERVARPRTSQGVGGPSVPAALACLPARRLLIPKRLVYEWSKREHREPVHISTTGIVRMHGSTTRNPWAGLINPCRVAVG